ncbi:MAG: hypothetical protein FH761_08435 [Firmicutes bacterium]|nr:hypothetical protein [Bacillota bacterium]
MFVEWLMEWDGKEKEIKEIKKDFGISKTNWQEIRNNETVRKIMDKRNVQNKREGRKYYLTIEI